MPVTMPTGLHALIPRGKNKGKYLYPHCHEDRMYVVSPDRFEKNYVRVAELRDLPAWLAKGYSLRMSNLPEGITAPSLITPTSVKGWK
ncbi:MAG: hypothetical protein KGZ68_18665 [Dechloromonas sp.]|nr:hypothetical protein [Dechloromonas sp.]